MGLFTARICVFKHKYDLVKVHTSATLICVLKSRFVFSNTCVFFETQIHLHYSSMDLFTQRICVFNNKSGFIKVYTGAPRICVLKSRFVFWNTGVRFETQIHLHYSSMDLFTQRICVFNNKSGFVKVQIVAPLICVLKSRFAF